MPKNIIFTKESEAMDYAKDIGGELNPVDGGFTVDKVMYMHEGGGLPPHDHATSGAVDPNQAIARDLLPHETDLETKMAKEKDLETFTEGAKKSRNKPRGVRFRGTF